MAIEVLYSRISTQSHHHLFRSIQPRDSFTLEIITVRFGKYTYARVLERQLTTQHGGIGIGGESAYVPAW